MLSSVRTLIACTIVLISGCNSTSKIGSGPLFYSPQLDQAYQEYLHKQQFKDQQYSSAALALNPKTGRIVSAYATSRINSNSTAKRHALKKCGKGCYIFAINKKIVWKGVDTSPEYKSSIDPARMLELDQDGILRYKPSDFEITQSHKDSFSKYLSKALFKEENQNHAFAISKPGYSGYAQHSDSFTAKIEALKACEIISFGHPCFLYALNGQTLSEE
ncbi:hypothetical protein [Kiloniella majae]|uniref:hypothetical protein n=1 Tax=Kiloniella majae TaxID=1938558 RepID=UPI000F79A913|nr:hypothetical protein [Kiloniella majae]